jgi:hypothetical protein
VGAEMSWGDWFLSESFDWLPASVDPPIFELRVELLVDLGPL